MQRPWGRTARVPAITGSDLRPIRQTSLDKNSVWARTEQESPSNLKDQRISKQGRCLFGVLHVPECMWFFSNQVLLCSPS